jgi:hypothetical protein
MTKQYKSDNLLGFQEYKPVFVKTPFAAFGKQWKPGEEFNWMVQPCKEEDWDRMRKRIQQFYRLGKIHHDSAREVEQKVGDRLGELNTEKLQSLVRQVNAVVKKNTTTSKEAENKRLKQSKIDDKQRGLIRAWLNRNPWATEEFYRIRDNLLNDTKPEETTEQN